MLVRINRILTPDEYQAMQDEALAKNWWRNDRRMFLPGMAWYMPWYFDPTGKYRATGKYVMFEQRPPDPGKRGFLSPHYWRDWAEKRPPICVVCPNGEQWEIDRRSSNGDGWVVKGNLPLLQVSPSIVVEGYHGWLGVNGAEPGQFSADLEGRGEHGTARPIEERK